MRNRSCARNVYSSNGRKLSNGMGESSINFANPRALCDRTRLNGVLLVDIFVPVLYA